MKRSTTLVIFLAVLSVISGYLFSKASLVGRAGMSLFYHEYNFLKTWWKGGLLVFAILAIVYGIHTVAGKRLVKRSAQHFYIGMAIIAIAGMYYTYYDFRHTLSHRWLGERFHIGAYLFWAGWIVISCFHAVPGKYNSPVIRVGNGIK